MNFYFWRFIFVLVPLPLVALGLFVWKKPRFSPIYLAICPVMDVICYWGDLLYYESRPLILFFIIAQLIIVALLAYVIKAILSKRERDS